MGYGASRACPGMVGKVLLILPYIPNSHIYFHTDKPSPPPPPPPLISTHINMGIIL